MDVAGPSLRAVIFDWRGTLVLPLSTHEAVTKALASLGRPLDEAAALVERLHQAWALPHVRDLDQRADSDQALHRALYDALHSAAGIDEDLARALYDVESDLGNDRYAEDVAIPCGAISQRGIKIAVLSDIHVDLRATFDSLGARGLIDVFVLSYEHGVQKPDAAIFEIALAQLRVSADKAVMVGDRARWDGGAVDVGITTLILPPLTSTTERRLFHVLRLLGL